jgi:hypothetical protein
VRPSGWVRPRSRPGARSARRCSAGRGPAEHSARPSRDVGGRRPRRRLRGWQCRFPAENGERDGRRGAVVTRTCSSLPQDRNRIGCDRIGSADAMGGSAACMNYPPRAIHNTKSWCGWHQKMVCGERARAEATRYSVWPRRRSRRSRRCSSRTLRVAFERRAARPRSPTVNGPANGDSRRSHSGAPQAGHGARSSGAVRASKRSPQAPQRKSYSGTVTPGRPRCALPRPSGRRASR